MTSGLAQAPVRLAVLDLDGTLYGGFLAARVVEELLRIPGRDPRPGREALGYIDRYARGVITHDECAEGFYRGYTRAVRGLSAQTLARLSEAVWSAARSAQFRHARPLVAELRNRGYRTWLLSGSPEQAVRAAAGDLGAHDASGAAVTVRDGVVAGHLLRGPAQRGGKGRQLDRFTRDLRVDWRRSFAIGDSSSDIEILERVGLPVAFEPDPQLTCTARERGWLVTDRHGVLAHCRALLDRHRPRPHESAPHGSRSGRPHEAAGQVGERDAARALRRLATSA